jgi:ABC-type nitrate/sulfonate/bicarbonate transport system permease component
VRGRATGVALVVGLLALWEASVRFGFVTSTNWPAFSSVLAAAARGLADGELVTVIGSSLVRMACGYVIGTTLGIVIGLGIALFRPVRLTLEPAIELIRPVPITAIIPALIFIFGLDDPLKVTCVAVATFFPVVVNTIAGASAVDPVYIDVCRTFGIPRATTILRVVIPAALPYILAGMRTALAVALVVTVIAEMLAGQQGVGYYLISMQYALRAPEMYGSIVVLTLTAYALNRAFVWWEGRVIHWARASQR